MNCAYHSINSAVVNCNGCGRPLCAACDHRIKGFPFCQDCIVSGIDLLRERYQSSYVPFVKKQTSPFVASVLSLICPGLGAAYNGQTTKAIVYFAVFVGLFQMAILTGGTAIFVLGFLGMWLFAALDSWRTAQLIRAGITPSGAEDIIVQRISGSPWIWGAVLTVLGAMFFLQMLFRVAVLKAILPVLLIGLGAYLLRGYFFKGKNKRQTSPYFDSSVNRTSFRTGEFDAGYTIQTQSKGWKSK